MKLKDVLVLGVDAKALAKASGLSGRQIRRLRQGGREIPDVDISGVEDMLDSHKKRNESGMARDAWYLAEADLLHELQEANRLEKAAASVSGKHTKELLELIQQFDAKIQAALKQRGVVSRAAQKLGVKAIWLPNGKEIDKLLSSHMRRLNEATDALESPAELMRRRVARKLAS